MQKGQCRGFARSTGDGDKDRESKTSREGKDSFGGEQ